MSKARFYEGLIGLAVFEILRVHLIMPMPGSQRMDSLDLAYFLHTWRWPIRAVFVLLALTGVRAAFGIKHKWIPVLPMLLAGGIFYFFNFQMTAERIFREPQTLTMATRAENALGDSSLVIGVAHGGAASAYPIRFLAYHHQVRDTVGGKPILVTYCSVCRSGRVFEPVVRGRNETFRLVGMDHWNAMFEDATTRSWWRQVNGEAVAGKLKGERLPDVASQQTTLGQWFALHPDARVMQADPASVASYDSLARFERGLSRGPLTRSDPESWQEKSWVVGVEAGDLSKAYDWNRLLAERAIHDSLGATPIVVVLGSDGMSFAAFERPAGAPLSMHGDTLVLAGERYDLSGRNLAPGATALQPLPAYQEFWHSWRTFHPKTLRD